MFEFLISIIFTIRLVTHPRNTRSGKSIVLAIVITTTFEPVRLGQSSIL